jgi:hypothetical protein
VVNAGLGGALVSGSLTNSVVSDHGSLACVSGPTNGGGNIDFPASGCPGVNVDPKLGPLEDNGGATETRALEAGSGAIDHVPASGSGCTATDQRGLPRPQGAACDSGAYEAGTPSATTGAAGALADTSATLNGAVVTDLRATTYYFRFGTTDAYGSRTAGQDAAPGVAATSVSAALTGLQPSTTYHFRIVATSEEGTAVGDDATFTTAATPLPPPPPPPPLPDTTKPVFLSASLSSKKWTLKRGTTFRYTLSEAAGVVFTIEKSTTGRKVGKSCKKLTKSNRKRKRCTRYKRAGQFAQASLAGANTKRFSGRIGGRSLSIGAYRASLVATDAAGNKSATKRLAFRVVR